MGKSVNKIESRAIQFKSYISDALNEWTIKVNRDRGA